MTVKFQSDAFQTAPGQAAFQEPRAIQLEIRDPRGLTVSQWADSMTMQLALFHPERIEEDWRGWAVRMVEANNITLDQAPDPYRYDDWRVWADTFNRALTAASY